MKRKTILYVVVAFVFLFAVLAVCQYMTAIICNECGMNIARDNTAQAIEATNQQVKQWLTGTAAAKTPTAEMPH